jgi:transposase
MRITKLQQVRTKGYEVKEWKRLYHDNQQEYIRKRLRFIASCVSVEPCLNRVQLQSKYGLDGQFDTWIKAFLGGGLKELCKPIKRVMKSRISNEQKLELKEIILTKTPNDFGYDRNLWTAQVIMKLLLDKWNIKFEDSHIYRILDKLGLSHQKAHRDYANSDPELRKERRDLMEKKLLKQKSAIL